jgi:hypothetical protein
MLSELARSLGLWLCCVLGEPIYSPSRALWDGELLCLHCGKCHGKLLKVKQIMDDFNKPIPPEAIDRMVERFKEHPKS